ncbi:hypothetical protein [Thioclava indica]|uniref:Uncharacterized protein n=1 Tax=Thioclava indica TaxID=1353528 RepID=A0A074JXW6_9RHOB|nr:hypothetical protein [Thioclava indica]KEO61334.1 hypothetical protein DT23_09590 [Thioclava indica]
MSFSRSKVIFAGVLALSIPATIALASVSNSADPQMETPRQTMLNGYVGSGRPMDSNSAAIPYGDLSAFDKITTIGAAQSPDVPFCDHRGEMLKVLQDDFAESPRFEKSLGSNRKVELLGSNVMGTWTALYTRADGVSCVVSSGMDWKSGENPIALLHKEGILPAT